MIMETMDNLIISPLTKDDYFGTLPSDSKHCET